LVLLFIGRAGACPAAAPAPRCAMSRAAPRLGWRARDPPPPQGVVARRND